MIIVTKPQRAAYEAQQKRLEAHYRLRPPHPNEATLKQMAENPNLLHDEEYWQKRQILFRPVYEAIEEWGSSFWTTETYIPDPDDNDEL
jgi:hypothetical protein